MGITALFGGTFNPVHLGHERLARQVAKELSPDRIVIIPSKIPPHKQAVDLASGEDRMEMCRLAFSGIENVIFSDIELKRQGKSYSLYTVRHFREEYEQDQLYFIMGGDMLLTFDQWYRYEEIAKMCGIICVSRENEKNEAVTKRADELSALCSVIRLDVKPIEVSSTQIRQMIKENADCSCYLNKKVVQYIKERDLYRDRR